MDGMNSATATAKVGPRNSSSVANLFASRVFEMRDGASAITPEFESMPTCVTTP